MVHTDPVINIIIADRARPEDRVRAEEDRLAQYAAWDMIAGRMPAHLRGAEMYVDIMSVGYCLHNQPWDFCDQTGERAIYQPLARELRRQRRHFERHATRQASAPARVAGRASHRAPLPVGVL